eukprot:2823471-Amphidinium_carterae.4
MLATDKGMHGFTCLPLIVRVDCRRRPQGAHEHARAFPAESCPQGWSRATVHHQLWDAHAQSGLAIDRVSECVWTRKR